MSCSLYEGNAYLTIMNLVYNNPKHLLSYDRNFVILRNGNDGEETYVIYNSTNHAIAKLSYIEFFLLDLLYKYEDPRYISLMVDEKYRTEVFDTLTKESVSKLISIKIDKEEAQNKQNEVSIPSTYYLHLTDRCNLRCAYCYNRTQRSERSEFPFDKWIKILNKILPYADHIILTGGECFLHPDFGKIVRYIKNNKKGVYLSCISNGMHDFKSKDDSLMFECIDCIMFSCDSLEREGKRVGFKPKLFLESINFFLTKYPKISLEISATRTIDNDDDLKQIKAFCTDKGISHKFINLIPEGIEGIKDMPMAISCFSQHHHCISMMGSSQWPGKNTRCGAGFKVLSISSKGDAYPCQALHYKDFLMGNMLENDLMELKYIKDQTMCLPGVDDIDGCKSCNIRYVCGGGCLAASYPSNGYAFKRNRLICPYNYENAMRRLINFSRTPNNPSV